MSFIAIDVETANENISSICAIGVVSFRQNVETKSLHYLIDPEEEFSEQNIAVHGILPEHVRGQPPLRQVLPILFDSLNGRIVAHHTAFDRAAFARAAEKYGTAVPELHWLDTARLARRTWPEVMHRGYGLAHLAKKFDIVFQHHNALEDARACGLILQKIMAETGETPVLCLERARSNPFGQARLKAQDGCIDGPLYGETIVFTGSLKTARAEAAERARIAGCAIRDSVTAATTILVVGDQDIRKLAGAAKSTKHRKAEEMVRAGARLRILTESDFQSICGQS